MKAWKGYSMLFKDSVMLMFSSRRDMAMLTMKAKTKVRITARAKLNPVIRVSKEIRSTLIRLMMNPRRIRPSHKPSRALIPVRKMFSRKT